MARACERFIARLAGIGGKTDVTLTYIQPPADCGDKK